ncbi:MAG: hypothetical protein P8Z30_11045 [Acidobacteriota bacterium]
MKQTGCENEERVLEALGKGCVPEAFEEPLRQHVAGCASCAELVVVYEMFQKDSERLSSAAPVPEAGRVWWRAARVARRAAAERAMRPILIAEKAALAVGGGVLIALLIFAAPWLARQFEHSNLFPGTVVYSLPLTALIVTSIILCLLVMAGALFTLWAEK